MPAIRVVMPDGTTKSFPEGTKKAVVEAAKRDMIASMSETAEHIEAWRSGRRAEVTAWSKPAPGKKPGAEKKKPEHALPEPPDIELDLPDESYAATYKPSKPTDRSQEEVDAFERDYKASTDKFGDVMEKSGQAIGAMGPKNVGIPLQAGGEALKLEPGQTFIVKQATKASNFMRDPNPLPGDWILRSIIGDRAADAIGQSRLPQQINNVLGNNALRANGGLAPRR